MNNLAMLRTRADKPAGTSPRSRTAPNEAGCPHRNLRIRGLGFESLRAPSHSPLLIMKQPLLLQNLLQLRLAERSRRDAAAPRQLGLFILGG
jgi:hypothetical protein